MAHIEIQGRRFELVEDWRIGEQIEAENALGIDLEDAKSAAKTALIVYMSIRRVDAEIMAGPLADMVKNMSFVDLVTESEEDDEGEGGDAGPPEPVPAEGDEDAAAGNGDSGTDAQLITGHLRSASSA